MIKKAGMKPITVSILFFFATACGQRDYQGDPQQAFLAYEFSEQEKRFQKEFIEEFYYQGEGGVQNYYARISRPRNPVLHPLILVTGLEDIVENWWLVAQEAINAGFGEIYIYEIRGQGRSQRVPGNNIKAAHVNVFENYGKDFLRFLRVLQKEKGSSDYPPFFVAHSTGSLVVSSALPEIKQQLPDWYPAKMVYWAPLIKLNVSPWLNNPIVKSFLTVVDLMSRKMGVLILGKKFSMKAFEDNSLSGNRERYEWSERIHYGNGWASSGVSLKWVLEAIRVSEKHLENSYQVIDRPTRIYKAGKDKVVRNDWSLNNPNIEVRHLPDAQHALHIEDDNTFQKITRETFDFFLFSR